MVAHHEPLRAMGPVEWTEIPQDDIKQFLADTFAETQTVVESIPAPTTTSAASTGRARSKTESAVHAGDITRALSQRQTAASITHAQDLRKDWKEIKVSPKDNPLGINVYKLGAKDGKGAWFARRSVHEGLGYDDWKKGLEMEFNETMKIQGSPGSGNIRGIGAEKRVEHQIIDDAGQLQVFQLSAQFPGPTAPRDFVTLLLTSESAVKPIDGSRPLRQFMIVSKPCQHPECPPRQGIIRGVYESVEIIREIPIDNPANKRSLSSADLGRDETRRRSGIPASDSESTAKEDAPMAVEWLMVTRSDPGGSVPRFLIEKGTPPGIVGDAGKFIKWVTAKANQGFVEPSNEDGTTEDVEMPELDKEKTLQLPPRPSATRMDRDNEPPSQGDEDVPSSNGLYGIIAGAIGAASSIASGLLQPFGSFSETGSNADTSSDINTLLERHDHETDESAASDTSSVRSFASALEGSLTAENKTAESIAESHSETSRSNLSTQQDKELKKLQERRRKLDEKVAKLQERRNNKLQGEKEKDAATVARLREKHEREVAKQEEKYRRELRKIEEKREQELRKAEERRRKTAEKEEKNNLAMELEKAKAERDLARKQIEILDSQVAALQAQNTMLVRKLGKMGLIERSDSTHSFSSLTKPEAKISPPVS
ncbi:Fc.00g112190.m01.CDS01 [Cosmosporella sp. VM-42]